MPRAQGTEADPAPGVAPPARPSAPWRISAVVPSAGAILQVTFLDGASGEVRMQPFLKSPAVEGTPFEALRDPAVFSQAHVRVGTVVWPSGAELAPDALYDAIRAHGVWTLS